MGTSPSTTSVSTSATSAAQSREWVGRLPAAVKALNSEVTRLIGMRPHEAIKLESVTVIHSTSPHHVVGLQESHIDSSAAVRFLYQPKELEGVTHPTWS